MRFYSSFIQLCAQASQQTKPNKTWSAAASASSPTLKGRSLALSFLPPKILPSFLFLHPNRSQCFELTTFVFSNYFHSSAWRTDLENKHKLIPNTLIISNEHLSYSISEEPMCYTARKPHDSKSEALQRHGGGRCLRLPRSTEGSRVPLRRSQPVWGAVRGSAVSAGQREQCGAVRSVRGSAVSAVSAGRPGRGRRARGSRAARAGAALCWPQRDHRTRHAAFPPRRSSGRKYRARWAHSTSLETFLANVFCGFVFLQPLCRSLALLLFKNCMNMK